MKNLINRFYNPSRLQRYSYYTTRELFVQLYQDIRHGFPHLAAFQLLYSLLLTYLIFFTLEILLKVIEQIIVIVNQFGITPDNIKGVISFTPLLLIISTILLVVYLRKFLLVKLESFVHNREPVQYLDMIQSALRNLPAIILFGFLHVFLVAAMTLSGVLSLRILFTSPAPLSEPSLYTFSIIGISFFLLYRKTMFVFQALAIEHTGIRYSLQRSYQLTKQHYWSGFTFYPPYYFFAALVLLPLVLVFEPAVLAIMDLFFDGTVDSFAHVIQVISKFVAGLVTAAVLLVFLSAISSLVTTIRYYKQREIHDR